MAYGSYAGVYWDAGWRCILPVPPKEKHPPPEGYTGEHGTDEVAPETIAEWRETQYYSSIALRLPAGVIAIDVDHYDKLKTLPDHTTITVAKHGDDTLRAYEAKWGPLPPTWASTARGTEIGPGPSRTLFYRVPPGRYRANLPDAIEILQRHHRYCVVWPSPNPDAGGSLYRWYGPSGAPTQTVPESGNLPELPAAWVTGLAEGASASTPAAAPREQAMVLLAALMVDDRPPCKEITNDLLNALEEFAGASAGSRHDAALGRVYLLIRHGALGHCGTGPALEALRVQWEELTAGEDREGEWLALCVSAAAKMVTELGSTVQVPRDPCAMWAHWELPVPGVAIPDDSDTKPVDIPIVGPPVLWSRRSLIGTGAFDPRGALDQVLAAQSLERIGPILRYATDSGSWILRGPHRWELMGSDMADWALTELFDLMPTGDPDADDDSESKKRADRRKRFGQNSGASGIASKLRAMVRAPGHPATVRLGELDADPEILWAGGLPWSLRDSFERPAMATMDTCTPHLHSAGVPPSGAGLAHPTPVWDAYTATIWPDNEVREYALQVLAVGLTGYSDAVLPMLWGQTGTGKTSLASLIMSLLGSYAVSADPRLLTNTDNAHASIVFALMGARWAFIDEGPREGKLATGALKRLTGGAQLTGNAMRANPITFRPTHTLVLTCNPEETPTFSDPALRRRVRLLPCEGDAEAVAATRAALTPAIWQTEAPGVLAALMHRAAMWLADRRVAGQQAAPDAIRYRAEEIAADQDLVTQWIDSDMEAHASGTRASELLGIYADWLRRFNIRPPSPATFGRKLTELGYPPIHHNDGKYRGLRRRPTGASGPYVPPPSTPAAASPLATATLPPVVTTDTRNAGPIPPPPGPPPPPVPPPASSADAGEGNLVNRTSDADPCHPDATSNRKSGIEQSNGVPQSQDQRHEWSNQDHEQDLDAENLMHSQVQTTCSTHGDTCTTQSISGQIGQNGVTGVTGLTGPNLNPSQDQEAFDPVLLVGSDGVHSLTRSISQHLTDHDQQICKYTGNTEKNPSPVTNDHFGAPDQANQTVTGWAPSTDPSSGQFAAPEAIPLTEQQGHAEAALAALRAQRNELTKTIKKTPEADRGPLAGLRELLVTQIKTAERRVREVANAIRKQAAIEQAGGDLLELPALKSRHGMSHSVTVEQAAAAVRAAMANRANPGRCTVDIESTAYPIGHPDHAVRTVQLGNRDTGAVFDVADPVQFATAAILLAEAPELEAYSAAVEISHLSAIGMLDYDSAWRRVHDVVIKAQLHNPVGTLSSDQGLKPQAETHIEDAVTPDADKARAALFSCAGWLTDTKVKGAGGSEEGWVDYARSGWAQVDPRCRTMVNYAVSDVHDTAALGEALPLPAPAVYARERRVQAAVGAVSWHGIRLDGQQIERQIEVHQPLRDAAAAAIRAAGIDNPGSNDQVAEALIRRGVTCGPESGQLPIGAKSGKPSVKAQVLKRLARTDAIASLVDDLLKFRHHNRVLTTYLGPYSLLVRRGDGRMRSTVYTLQADTGRFSCVHENLQNTPRIGGIRECFICDPGELFVDADLSGVEVAVLAALSQDAVLLELVRSGQKLHKIIAELVYGPNYAAEQYNYVKNGVFAKLYGAGIPRLVDTVGCTEQEIIAMVDALDRVAPGVKRWGYQMRDMVAAGMDSYELYSGRVLHLPARFPHKIVNYLVQGTAREVFVDGLLRWSETRWGMRRGALLVPVHDEILSTVPAAEAPEAMTALAACMSTDLYGVHIGAEPKWTRPADRWLGNDNPLGKAA